MIVPAGHPVSAKRGRYGRASGPRSMFEMLSSGRVVSIGALLTMKPRSYYLPWTITNGLVASSFFAFFRVFLAILFSFT
jgi:hypothetical protein